MSLRGVRVGLTLLFVAALCGAGYQIFIAERRIGNERRAASAFDDLAWAVTVSIADLHAAQQAYVVEGQDASYWTAKASSDLDTLTTRLASLRQLSIAQPAEGALTAAAEVIDTLRQVDARAREYTARGQRVMASDLIFTDGMELTTEAAGHMELARTREREMRGEAVQRQRQGQVMALAAAAGTGLLVVLLLLPAAGSSATQAVADAEGPPKRASAEPATGGDRLLLTDFELEAESAVPLEPDAVRAAEASEAPRSDPAEVKGPDLRTTAELCTDFGRVSDRRDLPVLLERAAQLLNASGIIVWIGEPSSHELRPALGYGYPPQVLARMGSVSRDADNATAAAYRAGRMQTVEGEGGSTGALVAPLITATSCIGVMAAEVRNGSESSEPVQAVATILAAQVASIVAPAPPAEATQAQQG